MAGVSAEVARAAEGKMREALNQFKKALSLTVETLKPGLTRREEPINWDYWRKEINTPGLVDEMKTLYEKGLPEHERVYITPELNNHLNSAAEAVRSNATVEDPSAFYSTLLKLVERARADPAAAKKAAFDDLRKRLSPAVPDAAIELLIEGKKSGVGLAVAASQPLTAEEQAKLRRTEATRADVLAKAAEAAYAAAAAELKSILSPLFPADALLAVARNDRVALVERPDFAIIRDEIAAKRNDVARVQARARLAINAAEDKFDAELARLQKLDIPAKGPSESDPLMRQVAAMVPDNAETKFFRAVMSELAAQSSEELLSGKAPRLTPQRMLELAKSAGAADYAQLIERVAGREKLEQQFEKQIQELKTAFQSFRPFDQMTVAEVFAQHPEWEKEFDEELRQHKWGYE